MAGLQWDSGEGEPGTHCEHPMGTFQFAKGLFKAPLKESCDYGLGDMINKPSKRIPIHSLAGPEPEAAGFIKRKTSIAGGLPWFSIH